MKISREHALLRFGQIQAICSNMVEEELQEIEDEYREAQKTGLPVQKRNYVMDMRPGGIYYDWHQYLAFYSQFI